MTNATYFRTFSVQSDLITILLQLYLQLFSCDAPAATYFSPI